MSVIKCFEKLNNQALTDSYLKLTEGGLSDYEAARKVIDQEQKAIFDALNKFKREKLKSDTDKFIAPIYPQKEIDALKAKNEEAKKAVIPKNPTPKVEVAREPEPAATESDIVKTPILKRLNKAFLNIGAVIFDNAQQLMDKAMEIIGQGDSPQFNLTPEQQSVKAQLDKAKAEYQTAKKAFDAKRKEFDNEVTSDNENLFGERKVSTGMFDVRVSQSARNEAIKPYKARLAKAEAEVNRLQKKYDSLGGQSAQTMLFSFADGTKKEVKTVNADVVNGFYSPLEKIINEGKQDKMPAKQWIEKFGKGEEAKWTGLTEWLGKQEGSVSKADIQKYLKDNRIEVVEVVKDDRKIKITRQNVISVDEDETSWYVNFDNNGRIEVYKDDANGKDDAINIAIDEIHDNIRSMSRDELDEAFGSVGGGRTKYEGYQTPGEKENYKEVLVTMPETQGREVETMYDDFGNPTTNPAFKPNEIKLKDAFKSSHFNEPNILVHLRMNTRTDAQGNKVLFLEEVQSDWGQEGKKKGFKEDTKIPDGLIVKDDKKNRWRLKTVYDPSVSFATKEEAEAYYIKTSTKATIPAAPFVMDTNAWTKLGLKIALKEAVKQGADKIAWTTGEQQNDRYDLSKQVDSVAYRKNLDGTYLLMAVKGDDRVLDKDKVPANKIEDYFGKDIANRILSEEGEEAKVFNKHESIIIKELSGVQLKIGGKGMKGFYGSPTEGSLGIVGNVAKSLFKQEPKTVKINAKTKPLEVSKWDGKEDISDIGGYENVEKGDWLIKIPTGERYTITKEDGPTKEAAVAEFKRLAVESGEPSDISSMLAPELVESNPGKAWKFKGTDISIVKGSSGLYFVDVNGEQRSEHKSFDDAKKSADKLVSGESSTQHSIDITPELQSQASEGQPLFHYNKAGEILGFTHNGKIYLNGEKITARTTMEEAGHIWINWAKENRSDLHKAGLKKVAGSSYLESVQSSKQYQTEALKQGPKDSPAYNAYMLEEALAKAIADNGAKFVSESRKESFREWVREMWSEIIKAFGIRNLTPEQIDGLSLEEFAKKAAADVFSKGKSEPSETKTGPPPIPPAGTSTSSEEGNRKQRKFSIQLLDSLDLSYQVKKGLSEDAITYIPKGIRISNTEARAIVEAKGSEQATKDFLDMTNGMLPDVRVMLGENLIKKFNEEENWDGAIRVADNLAMQLTDLGRGVNAAKVFQLLTPEGVIRYVQKEITKAKDKHSRETEPKRKRSKKEIDAITEKAIAKVLGPDSEISKSIVRSVKKGKVKQAIDFLEKLKIQQPKGMASSMIVPLGLPITAWNTAISIIQDALKAGLTISQAINKAIHKLKEKGHSIDESKFRAHFDDALKDYRVALDPTKAVKEELKSQGTSIEKIIRTHYTEQEITKTSLVDKLVKDANLDPDEAKVITDQLVKTIDDLTRAAKEKALKNYLPKPKKGQEKEHKSLIDEIVEASNLGALDEDEYRDAISAKLGPKQMTEGQSKEVKALSERIQKAKSDFDKTKAQEDLIRFIDKNIKGIRKADVGMAIWYANILSGLSTQMQNLFGNMTKTLDEAYTTAMMNPKEAGWIFKGLFQGYGRGILEAADTFKSGYQPIKGDVKQLSPSPVLEQVSFKGGKWNPYNYLKYVTRLMVGTDIFFYHGLKEMRSRELSVAMAKKANKVNPGRSIIAEAKKSIYGDENAWFDAKEQAAAEGYSGKELTRRAFELIEKSRPETMQMDSNDAALRGTYNNDPLGALGLLSGAINMVSEKVDIKGVKPIKFIVPFTRIVANVANSALEYSPWAFGRYAKGAIGYEGFGENYYHKYTEEEKAKLLIRGITGTIAMAALAALTDDEDGIFNITADGTGDMTKNFELMNTGWQPYSIKIGDTWYEYRNTPLAIPFAMVGYWRDGIKYHGQKENSERFSILMYGSLKYIMDLSFLQSLSSFFDTFSKENASQGKNFFSKTTKESEKIIKSVLMPNAFTQASRSMQEIMDMPIKQARDLGAQITRDIPVLRDRLDNMYNSLGDPVIPNQVSKFLPFKMRSEPTGKDKELYDLISDNGAWIMKPGRGTIKIATGESMTDDEYEQFSYQAGKLTKQKLMDNFAELKSMKDREEIKDLVQKLKTQARREANLVLFGEKSYF